MKKGTLLGRRQNTFHPWQYRLLVTIFNQNRRLVFILFALCWLILSIPCWSQLQYLDVLYLKDGQSFKGLIIEQTPEGRFRLETSSGSVLSFSAEEIERILKEQTPGTPAGLEYRDVVFLNDGVIFSGIIVEQVLGESVTLQTENDCFLILRLEEIWKIVKEKRLAEIADVEKEREGDEIKELKSQLQLRLISGATSGLRVSAVREAEQVPEDLEEEIERLKEEMDELSSGRTEEELSSEKREALEALQTEIQNLEEEVERLEAEKRLLAEQPAIQDRRLAELEAIHIELQRLIDELLETAKGMWTEEIVGEAGAYKAEITKVKTDLQALVSDLVEVAKDTEEKSTQEQQHTLEDFKGKVKALSSEMRTISRARRQEDVRATEFILGNMMEGGTWRDPEYRSVMMQMATVLPRSDRLTLYEKYKRKDEVLAASLNLIPGVAIGSWTQGDVGGAAIANILELGGGISFGLIYSGVLLDPGIAMDTFYYIAGGIFGAGYVFSLIRPFLYTFVQNRNLSNVLGLSEAPPVRKEKERKESYEKLGKVYFLVNPGGIVGSGPVVEIGWQVLPETLLGAHVRFIGFGLGNQLPNPDGEVALYSIAPGIHICRLFKPKYSHNRVYTGCIIDVDLWDETWDAGTVYEWRNYSYFLTIMPGVGYRLRFPSRFFINLGAYFGASIGLYGKSWNTSAPEIVYEGKGDSFVTGMLELSLGWEF